MKKNSHTDHRKKKRGKKRKRNFNKGRFFFHSYLDLSIFAMVALTKNNSKADVAGVVDTINKRVSGMFTPFFILS